MFTANQIETLLNIIRTQHILFIATQIGPEMLSDSELSILREIGFDVNDIKLTPFEEMFRWGMLSSSIGLKKAKNFKYDEFKRFVQSGNYLPLTPVERTAYNISQRQAASDIRGLGNRISQQTGQILIEADRNQRKQYEKIITEETASNIKNRGTISNLVSNLGHRTGDWARDFGRISDYVMHQAYEEGRAAHIMSQHGADALVYKKVFKSACKKCIELYLTKGFDSQPILFKLSDLIDNGSNIGRKVSEWLPVVGPTHPWCRCMLVYVDPNYEWSEEDGDFTKPKEYQRRVTRQSRVTVTIGDNKVSV
jgi:hypothetical protein